jgi:hypothetical protein
MLHARPFHHREEPILEWVDRLPVLEYLELQSLSILCTGLYTGLDYDNPLQLQHVSSVRKLEVGTNVVETIEPSHFPPNMDTLYLFNEMPLCRFLSGQLARPIHLLCQIRINSVCPELHGIEMG